MTKRIAIAELEGVALNNAVMDVCGVVVSDMLDGMSDDAKRYTLAWANPSGFVEVPDELVEGNQ